MDLCITNNLMFMRHKNGYTMEALAEIISVSRQTVAKWESGESYPDIMNCMKLATLYKITLDELVYKPLSETQASEFSSDQNKICGILNIDENCAINLPEPLMEMSDISGFMICLYAIVASRFSLFHVTSLCLLSVLSKPGPTNVFWRF